MRAITQNFALIAAVFCLLVFARGVAAQQSVDVDLKIKKLFELVNEYRVANGLSQLKPSVKLTEVANWMAKDMAEKNYMSHTDSFGRDPFQRMEALGYTLKSWRGENVAAGYESAETTLEGWKNSPGHNANLLRSEFTVMGLGRAYNSKSEFGWYWAQEFGGALDVEAAYNPLNKQPRGFVDGLDCTKSWGWAIDDDSTPPIYIRVYRDRELDPPGLGEAGKGGILVEEFIAPEVRSDIGQNVGFNWAVPNSLKDGSEHAIFIYGVDTDGGPNALLSNSPGTLKCSAPMNVPQPDLLMKATSFSPQSPKRGDPMKFDGTTINQGSGDAAQSFLNLRIDAGNNGSWDVLPGPISTNGSLRPHITLFTGSWIEAWQATAGSHKYEICADAGSSVAESNEANNCASAVFTVAETSQSATSTPTVPQEVPPAQTPTGLGTSNIPEGALIRAKGDIDIWIVKYVASKKFKRLILSPNVFNSYGHLRWEDVIEVEKTVIDSFTTSDLVRADGDAKVYRLFPQGDTGIKRWIPTAEAFLANGFDWDAVYTINNVDRDAYLIGESIGM